MVRGVERVRKGRVEGWEWNRGEVRKDRGGVER